MKTEIITSLDALPGIKILWDELFLASTFKTPFQTFAWQQAVARHIEDPQDLFFVIISDEQLPVGIAPLCREIKPDGRRLLRWLGAADDALDYQGSLIRAGRETEFYNALFSMLGEQTAEWDEIALTEIPSTLQNTSHILAAIERAGLYTHTLQESVSNRIPLPAAWEDYLSSLSAEFRGTLESTARKITRMQNIELVDLANSGEWQAGLEALFDMHQQRWTSKGENGVFAEDSTRRMHLEIVEQFMHKNMVRLPAFIADGEILAINYILQLEDTHYSYLSAYRMDKTWSKYSLGMQIRRASLVRAIESGVKTFDFLRGDEPYKQRFGAVVVQNLDIHIFHSKSRLAAFKTLNRLKEFKHLVPAPVKQFIKKSGLIQ